MFWVNMSSGEFGGEVFGEYDTPEEAAQAVARLALAAFNEQDDVTRSFTIIEADSRAEAEEFVAVDCDF